MGLEWSAREQDADEDDPWLPVVHVANDVQHLLVWVAPHDGGPVQLLPNPSMRRLIR